MTRVFRLNADCVLHADSPEDAIEQLHRALKAGLVGEDAKVVQVGELMLYEYIPEHNPKELH